MAHGEEALTKVHINLPNHWATDGESMWALPLGNDLYELRNTPFHAYDLNWGDVVRATEDNPNLKPEIREVVSPSGRKTLRVMFSDEIDEESQNSILDSLTVLNLSYERADGRLVAIDVHPTADYQAVCDKLWKLEQAETLYYETCEARVPGSFDGLAEAEEE